MCCSVLPAALRRKLQAQQYPLGGPALVFICLAWRVAVRRMCIRDRVFRTIVADISVARELNLRMNADLEYLANQMAMRAQG